MRTRSRTRLGTRSRRWIAGATSLVAALLVLGLVHGARADDDRHPQYRDFQLSGQYELHAQGKLIEEAKIYFSQRAAGYLVLTDVFDCGVLILPRSRCVESVTSEEMIEREAGGIDVRKDATPCSLGHFKLMGPDVVFKVGRISARLKPKRPLLGGHRLAKLIDHTPEYARDAKKYRPDATIMAQLKSSSKKARIQVFFGSWCTFCNRFLPNAIKVQEILEKEGKEISFEYFGLPAPPAAWVSETATKMGIKKLPTGIIYIDDKEVGRVIGTQWVRPERSLVKYLR